MNDDEKKKLQLVLYHVRIVRDKSLGLQDSIGNIFEKIDNNCTINGENPKGNQLNSINNEIGNNISSYRNHIIPNLINRINS